MSLRWQLLSLAVRASRRARLCAIALSLAGAAGHALPPDLLADQPPAEIQPALQSGRLVGEKVPQFYVRAVTGPLMNRSVCYVCRNGDRPVTMIFIREFVPELPALLQGIDGIIDQNRAHGLRGFGVLLTDDQRHAVSKLQTLAFDTKLNLPLTVAAVQADAPSNQNVHPDAAVTVVLYRRQEVVANFAFRAHELNSEGIATVLAQVRALAQPATAIPDSRPALADMQSN
jgi:hypothetical protein